MVSPDVLARKRALALHYTCSRPIQTRRRHFKLSVDWNIVVLCECAYQLDYVMVLNFCMQQSTSFRVFLISIL